MSPRHWCCRARDTTTVRAKWGRFQGTDLHLNARRSSLCFPPQCKVHRGERESRFFKTDAFRNFKKIHQLKENQRCTANFSESTCHTRTQKTALFSTSSRSSVDRALVRCSGGHGFDYHRELNRFFSLPLARDKMNIPPFKLEEMYINWLGELVLWSWTYVT